MKIYLDKIKEACSRIGITETELCRRANVSRVTYWTWKKKGKSPTPSSIKALAAVLHVPVSYISELKSTHEESEAPVSELTDTWLSFANTTDIDMLEKENGHINRIKKDYTEFRQALIIINALMNSMQFIFYIKDKNLKYLTANKAFIENAGLVSSYNVKNKEDDDFFASAEAKQNHQQDEQVFLTGIPVVNKEIYIPGTRKKKWGLTTKQIIFDTSGRAAGIIGIIIDITGKKIIDQKRILLENTLDHVTDVCIASGKFSTDSGRFIFDYINSTLKNMLQLPENYDYSSIPDLWLGMLPEESKKIFQKRRQIENFPAHFTYKAIRPNDKKTVWLQDSIYKSGERLISIVRDITEQKKLMAEIKDYEFIFDSIPVAIELLDYKDNKVIYSNNRVEEVFGFSKEQVADWNFWIENIVHPDDKQQQIEYEKSDKYPESRYYRIIRPNGKVLTVKNNHIIKNHNGRKYRIVTNIATE